MADNVQLNTGSGGDIAAADDIGGVKFQRIKLVHGADGVNDGDVTTANGFPVQPNKVASATLANVAASASNVTLQASNTARKGWCVMNDSASATLFIKFGATASATSYTVGLAPGGYYEMPSGVTYTGIIDGIWSAAIGAARVTEF